ncbi:MAG TPA: hypothetical protein VML50_11625 [Anaeromyxobacter sp.]|nr:hypothetical protein [Anaeromyxobacter sp.]
MARRRGREEETAVPGIAPVYEGPEVLDALLRKAGSPNGGEDVVAAFLRAQAAGEPRSAVIPALFPEEPHFASPDEARRLYGNLFGLWARLAAGLGAHDDAPEVVPTAEGTPLPTLPERGALRGRKLPASLVEAVWRNLASLPAREQQRHRDRFQSSQPDLTAWLETVPLPESGALAAQDLAFETWAMLDQAFGERLRAVEYRELRALNDEPPRIEAVQPAAAAYAAEQLDVLADEDASFDPPARAQVEKALAVLVAALTDAVREPS